MGTVVGIILVFIVAFAITNWETAKTLGLIIIGFSVIIAIMYKYNSVVDAKNEARSRDEEEKKRKQQEYDTNQQHVTQRLRGFVSESATIFRNLPKYIDASERALDQAQIEFDDGAFAPFWDAVERAANHLASFSLGIQNIHDHSLNYKSEKLKINSAPPPFQLDIDALPDATHTANRMRSIVRIAQKNFHFATIYEQRKTNKLLVTGFTSLGEALSEMSYRIESSMSALSSSISEISVNNQEYSKSLITGIESLREEVQSDAAARRDHERKERDMLDNIQRGRKPLL